MIYKFRIISGENEDFIREVAIDSQSTFFKLHSCIVEELGYDKSQITSFFITDQNWHKKREITLIDMTGDEHSSISVMDQTKLGELITEKKQRLLYVFDPFTERALFLELFGIEDQQLDQPVCIRRQGEAPLQFDHNAIGNIDFEEISNKDWSDKDILPEENEDLTSYDEEDWV
ncbi:IS1096 element passenger TnpR family protein [Thermophagus sp. OGC60D27]|uniref:IS1096 element passenger TnpR family protein n=1 Tax=Thermophagus sp. OGC60D27 TaxID=3458415 RepID=UPI004037B0D8